MSWNQLCSSQITQRQSCFAQDTPPTHCSTNLHRMCSTWLRPCLFTSDLQCWCELCELFPLHLLKKGEVTEGPWRGDFPEQTGILCKLVHITQSLFSLWHGGQQGKCKCKLLQESSKVFQYFKRAYRKEEGVLIQAATGQEAMVLN